MRVLSVVGNRPQFVKSGPLSVALRDAGISETVVHTGQHWDPEMSAIFFEELGLPEPAYLLDLRTADPETMEPAIREVPIFPETKPLDDLLAELQRQRSSIAVVSDEYGRTVGIVTVEDILEEVVGEIEDETDPRAASVRKLTDGDWYVRGHVSLGDLEDVGIRLPVSSDAFNSVGGYVFSELGRLPKRGDRIMANGYEIRVESVRDGRLIGA